MKRTRILFGAAALPLAWALVFGLGSGAESLERSVEARRAAATYPDYAGAVIPPNIAPLNLRIAERGRKYCLRIGGASGAPIEVFNAGGSMRIPPVAWRALLRANAGREIRMDFYVKGGDGWAHFDPVRNRVAAE